MRKKPEYYTLFDLKNEIYVESIKLKYDNGDSRTIPKYENQGMTER